MTVNTDIPLFTGVTLAEEYRRCVDAWRLGDDDVLRLARTSVERSLCPDHVRSAALRDLEAVTA